MSDSVEELNALAREVLARSLGTPTTPSTPSPERVGSRMTKATDLMFPPGTHGPDIRQLQPPSPLDLARKLLSNPDPPNSGGTWEKPDFGLSQSIQAVANQHPDAMRHVKTISFRPLGGDIGELIGRKNQGEMYVDPKAAQELHPGENPGKNLEDVLRHEMSHAVGWDDNYEDQPVGPTGEYGRRPITGIPRDAQDVDAASYQLHKGNQMTESTPTSGKPQEEKPHPGVVEAQRKAETTQLTPLEEALFQGWGRANGIKDVNAPEANYDYRGYYKATNGAVHPPGSEQHFPDTFKQHGHPTFSVESKYSKGPSDGGMWVPHPGVGFPGQPNMLPSHRQEDSFLPQPPAAVAHEPSETEKDPLRTVIDLMKQMNDSKGHDNKKYELKNPKPAGSSGSSK